MSATAVVQFGFAINPVCAGRRRHLFQGLRGNIRLPFGRQTIIDHNRPGRAGDWRVAARDIAAGAKEGEVDAHERFGGQLLHLNFLVAKGNRLAGRTAEESGSSRSIGNPRRSRTPSSSAPTAPVAPTTAM